MSRDFTIYKGNSTQLKYPVAKPFGNQNIRGGVNTLFSASEGIYAGGSFAGYFNRIARWDGNKWNKVGNGIYPELDMGINPIRYNTVTSIVKYKKHLYASTDYTGIPEYRQNVLHKFVNNKWESIQYKTEFYGSLRTMQLVVHRDYLYLIGFYGDVGDIHTTILRWDGINLSRIDSQNFTETTCAVSTPDGLYIAGTTIGGNSIKLLRDDGSFVDLPSTEGDTYWMKYIDEKLYISIIGESIYYYDEETETWSGLENLEGIRDFVAHDGSIYATGYFENEYGQSISRWDGSSWNPLSLLVPIENDLIPLGQTIISCNDGVYVGFGVQINDSNMDSGSVVSRWDGDKWKAIDSQKSPASMTINEPGILHANILSCSEGVYTSGQFTEEITLWNGNEFISLSGGIRSGGSYTLPIVSHSSGIYLRDLSTENSLFSRWDGNSWNFVTSEEINVDNLSMYYTKFDNDIYFVGDDAFYKYDGTSFTSIFTHDGYELGEKKFISSSEGIYFNEYENNLTKWDGIQKSSILLPSTYLNSGIGYNTGICEYSSGVCAVLSNENYLTQSIYSYINDEWVMLKNINVSVGRGETEYYCLISSGSNGLYLVCRNPLVKTNDELETNFYSLYLFDGTDIKKLLDTNNTILDLQEASDGIYICGQFDRQAIGICKLSESEPVNKPLIYSTNNAITINKRSPYKLQLG